MSHPARLSLRAPPHLPFIQGWPGIPASPTRKGPAVHGTVEVRIGPTPIKAKWVRAEIRKFESAPPGFPSNGETWEHVGEISTLWSAPAGKDWEVLEQADFKFLIPLPENIPPTIDISKGTGVRYELVAALCYRQKGGVFKKESAPIVKISEPIRITRHDLHSAWPVYNIPDGQSAQGAENQLFMNVQRPSSAFGPTDRILFTASLRSMRPKPFKLKGFECTLNEITTVIPPAPDPQSARGKKNKPLPQPVSKARAIATTRHAVDEMIGRGGDKSARIDMAIPTEKLLLTVESSRSLRVRYELEVKAVCDSGIPEIKVGGIKYTVGPFARSHAQQAVRDIGFVESLCPGQVNPANPSNPSLPQTSVSSIPSQPSLTPSPQPAFPPGPGQTLLPRSTSQPIQGFVAQDNSRRKSSDTSTLTTTTATTYDAHGTQVMNGRPQSMQQKLGVVPFPSANPAPPLNRTATGKTNDTSYTSLSSHAENLVDINGRHPNEGGQPDDRAKRYSSATTGTFGRWDQDLQHAMADGGPSSLVMSPSPNASQISAGSIPAQGGSSRPMRGPPSAWPSAEQEKMRLYNDARSRAATAQQSTGASLHALGMEELAAAPPEYAPPLPNMPNQDYKPPERPVSEYVSRSPDAGSSPNAQSAGGAPKAESPPPKPKGIDQVYLTAAEEKEQQRKRFEAAQSRIASGGSMAPSSGPKADSPPYKSKGADQVYLTAAEEKEQQRKRFEAAQSRVVSGGSIAPSSATASPQAASSSQLPADEPIPYDAIFPSASSSNEAAGSSSAQPSRGMLNAPTNGGLSEKEQMKRFYEAQDRVARAAAGQSSGSPPPATSTGPSPSEAIVPSSSNTSHRQVTQTDTAPTASQKEQLSRYPDSQDTAGQASGSGSSSQQSSGISATPPHTKPKSNGPIGLGIGMPPPAAISEKEQMRRYYEAQDRVARTASGGGGPSTSRDDPPPFDGPSKAAPATVRVASPSPYLTSAEEKEIMRKRFEAATAAVERNRNASGSSTASPPRSPPRASGSGGNSLPAQSRPDTNSGYMSAADEKEMMRKRFEDATAAVNRTKAVTPASTPPTYPNSAPGSPLVRDPTVKAGKARAMSPVPDGPPPPLPTKPPMEYINLLSPGTGVGSSFARLGGSGAGAGSGSPNMAPLGSVLSEANGESGAGSGSSK